MPDSRCNHEGCTQKPVARIFWPGDKPCEMCNQHVLALRRLAGVLGCYVHVEALPGFVEVPLGEKR